MYKNNILYKLIIIFVLTTTLFISISNKSHADFGNITFNNINIENGISQSTIEVIFQDSKGYIWLGTNDGLNKYNGYDFEIYNYEEGENSISHNGITDILEDKNSNIWVSTIEGINKIDTSTGKITNYTPDNGKLADSNIPEILLTHDNKIIATSYGGLYIYDEVIDKFTKVLNEDKGLISNTIYSIDEDSNNNLWIGTKLGVQKISNSFDILETYPIGSGEDSIGSSEVYNIYCDNKYDLVWAGTDSSGLFKIDTLTKNITNYNNNPQDKYSLPSNQVGAILRDSNDYLWIGTPDGLAYYNEEHDNFEVFKHKIYDRNSLVYNDVRSLMQDKEGIIWVGTYSGISIFDTNTTIKHYKAGIDEDYLLNENMVHGVYEDDEGYLWVGTKSKGVSIIDRENHSSKYLNTMNNTTIKSDSINDITGYKNLIFIATQKGVVKIDKTTGNMTNYSFEDGLIDDKVKDILVDDKGYLWIGTINGLNLLNIETGEIIDMTNYIPENSYVRYIFQDSAGGYFIGFLKDGGITYLNAKDNSIKHYTHVKGNEDSISSNRIRYINEDSRGNIWIGTSYGLNKFDKATEKFTRYTAKDGIANNTIYAVLIDNDDNIWISTNKGISKINQDSGKIQNFSVTDGLQSNEFNGNAAFKSKSGELFFGGVNGLNAFYPEDIIKVNTNTKVSFDNFKINDKKYSDINNLEFNHKSNTLTIEFFAPIYSNINNIMYEYALIGADNDVFTTKDNSVTYNDLKPGDYTFKVRVIDNGGNKSDINTVDFTIHPPFWISPLAIIIYVSLIILFILNQKYKVKKLNKLVKERTKLLEEEMEKNIHLLNKNVLLEQNKNSYFVNLSHELRTPLNIISSTNQLIKGLTNRKTHIEPSKISHYIDVSERNCKRLLNLINNIVDSSKLQNDMYVINFNEHDIVYIVEETALTLIDYINSKGINLIIDPEIEEKTILCDSYEIERCIINLVGNAARFTPKNGCITINIKDLDNKVIVSVKDTGCGIDKKYQSTIFDRFNQVNDIDNNAKGGSGLGLTITKQLVNLHNGDIFVESELDKGSTFTIILPVNPNISTID